MSATETIITTSGQVVEVETTTLETIASIRGTQVLYGTKVVGMDLDGAVREGVITGYPTERVPLWWVRVDGVQVQLEHVWPL